MLCPSWVSRATSESWPAAPGLAFGSCVERGTTVVLGGTMVGELGLKPGTKAGACAGGDSRSPGCALSVSVCHCCGPPLLRPGRLRHARASRKRHGDGEQTGPAQTGHAGCLE